MATIGSGGGMNPALASFYGNPGAPEISARPDSNPYTGMAQSDDQQVLGNMQQQMALQKSMDDGKSLLTVQKAKIDSERTKLEASTLADIRDATTRALDGYSTNLSSVRQMFQQLRG